MKGKKGGTSTFKGLINYNEMIRLMKLEDWSPRTKSESELGRNRGVDLQRIFVQFYSAMNKNV